MSGQGGDSFTTRDGGRRLGYARYGAAGGRPVFYFHGGLSSRLDIAFADGLCARLGVDLIAIDRPGIGLSDDQPRRTLRDWPADVAAVADDLHLDTFAVIGWSGGGPYVLACAEALRARITAAAIVAGMAPLDRPGALRELGLLADRLLFPLSRHAPALAQAMLALARLQPPAMIRASLLQSLSGDDRAQIAALSVADATDYFYEALRRGARGTVTDYRILGGVWPIDWNGVGPVTLWQGEDDRLVPPAHAHDLSARLPQASLNVVPGRGHFLLRGEAERVLSRLLSDGDA